MPIDLFLESAGNFLTYQLSPFDETEEFREFLNQANSIFLEGEKYYLYFYVFSSTEDIYLANVKREERQYDNNGKLRTYMCVFECSDLTNEIFQKIYNCIFLASQVSFLYTKESGLPLKRIMLDANLQNYEPFVFIAMQEFEGFCYLAFSFQMQLQILKVIQNFNT